MKRKRKVMRINGLHPTGVRRLIDALTEEMALDDIERLVITTRCRIAEEWTGYRPGLRLALKIFDDLCNERYASEIARRHDESRELVRRTRDKLLKLSCMRQLKRKLKALQSDTA